MISALIISSATDTIHSTNPSQLILRFKLFGDTFLFSRLFHNPIKHFRCPIVDLHKVAVQLATEKQSGMQYRTVLHDVPQMLPAPHSDRLGIFFVQNQTGNVIIVLQLISKTILLVINVLFHYVILQDFYIRTYVTSPRLPHSVISFYQIFLPLFLPLWGVVDKVTQCEIV